jgi:hypothetical protein
MEHLWSPVVAPGGNGSQIAQAQLPRDEAKTLVVAHHAPQHGLFESPVSTTE